MSQRRSAVIAAVGAAHAATVVLATATPVHVVAGSAPASRQPFPPAPA